MATFNLESQKSSGGSVFVIRLSGYFDAKAGTVFKTALDDLLKKGEKLFLFNFKSVSLINSPGVGSLLGVVEDITMEHGGKVAFCNLPQTANEVFNLVGIPGLYKIYEDEEIGLKSLAS